MPHPPAIVRRATTDDDVRAAFAVRQRVFVGEQGVPPELELDQFDASATHMVAEAEGVVVAAGRLVILPNARDEWGEARLGRISVLPEWRRRGIAGLIIGALESEAADLGFTEVSLHSQTYIQALYDKHGYVVCGAAFVDAGIDHVPMTKVLAVRADTSAQHQYRLS